MDMSRSEVGIRGDRFAQKTLGGLVSSSSAEPLRGEEPVGLGVELQRVERGG